MAKRDYLRSRGGIASFSNISHAPFLLMAQDTGALQKRALRLIALVGGPEGETESPALA